MFRRRENKEKTVFKHIQKRFRERFNKILSKDEYNFIIKQIQTGNSKHIATQSNARAIHAVYLDEKEYAVVYNKEKKVLNTVLPDNWKDTDYTTGDYDRFDYIITHSGLIQEV